MSDTAVLEIALMAIIIAGKLAAPILIVTLGVGFGISLLQSVTQIQEVTLTFVPKLGAVALVILLAGNWMLAEIVSFTTGLYEMIPQLADKV
ncbi:MAG: flagellar biosynthetic protein FliQ [Mycobacteriales bacterium]